MVMRGFPYIAFIAFLIISGLVTFVTQVEAQTADEQQQALIGEWKGVWGGRFSGSPSILIIHEIDTAKAKARCTYIDNYTGDDKKHPVLADFTAGPTPKLEFKLEGNEFIFVLKKAILRGDFKGYRSGLYLNTSVKMEKLPKK